MKFAYRTFEFGRQTLGEHTITTNQTIKCGLGMFVMKAMKMNHKLGVILYDRIARALTKRN